MWTQQPVNFPAPQQQSIPRPAVNIPPPTISASPIHTIEPAIRGYPTPAPAPVQPPMPTALQIAPLSWLQQQAAIGPGSYFQAPSMVPLVTIAPPPHIIQPTFAPILIHHHNESGSDDGMDIVDDDGDSWMRSSGFREATTPPEPAPVPLVRTPVITLRPTPAPPVQTFSVPPGPAPVSLVQTFVIPPEPAPVQTLAITPAPVPAPAPPVQTLVVTGEDAPQYTHVVGPVQQPTVGPTWGLLDSNARRLRKRVRASRLPYRCSIVPLAPSLNRWVGRLRRSVQTRRRGSTYTRHSTRNKDIARASMLEKRSLLRKKIAARGPKPRCLEKPTLLRVDDQPPATNPTAPVDPSSAQKKTRTYYDRLQVTRASPFSQRGPSEVSVLARKAVPELTPSRKAFILQRHFTARDRRAAGMDGRARIIHQNDLTAGHQTVAVPQQQPEPVQRRAPVGDHAYPRRKRKTAADYIRAEDAEKENEIFDAATDAFQSMDLSSEASAPVPSSSTSAAGVPASNPTPVPAPVTQDPEFNLDQAQLLLEDIFEDCENKEGGITASSSSSPPLPGSSSDSD